MQASLLLQRGCRLLSITGKICRGSRYNSRGGLAVAEWQGGERAASSGGRRGGARREDRAPKQASIWGDEWDVGAAQAGSQSAGWLDGKDVKAEDTRSSGRGGGSVRQTDRSERSGERQRPSRDGGGGNEWKERRSERSGSQDRPDRQVSSSGGREWRSDRGERSYGGGGRDGEREQRSYGGGRGGRDGEREQRSYGGGGGGRDGEREQRSYGGGGGGRDGEREQRSFGRKDGDSPRRYGGGGGRDGGQRSAMRSGGGGSSFRGARSGGRDGGSREGGAGRWEDRQSSRAGDERRRDPWAGGGEEEEEGDGEEAGEAGGGGGGGLRQFWVGDVLYGVSPVLAALQAGRRKVHTLYLQDGMDLSKRKDAGAVRAAKQCAEDLGAAVRYASKHDLNMVADNRPHQGVVLDCSALEFESMNTMPEVPAGSGGTEQDGSGGRHPVWLCLDEVMDPQNFGAALRCAHYLGVSGVLTCHRNSAPLSAAVSKASAGALEVLTVHSSKNLPQTLADARERGWLVLGAASEPGAVSCASFVLDRPAVLVMGNEGYGLRTTVRRTCNAMLQIEDGKTTQRNVVDSLNVSVASGILLHRLLTAQAPSAASAGSAVTMPAGVDAAAAVAL
ncbi:hypothetical protein D9Q98_009770 [Chlorella vulgaris]|uniref:rRNA methyltransferase 1, mitochondrial n=1 Tax=Chlorella vulgaris TaxID=3077 RepID=A0A9D4YSE6_CHLVU|nr:hypothetical protein D9Q98_009770 [Chlorella vulgaris]